MFKMQVYILPSVLIENICMEGRIWCSFNLTLNKSRFSKDILYFYWD